MRVFDASDVFADALAVHQEQETMLQCLCKDFLLTVEQIRAFMWSSAAS